MEVRQVIFSINTGLLEACVLAILKEEDSYGYKLTQDVKSLLPISESTLYPVLRRLEKSGCLKTYNKPIDGRNRKYYRITKTGMKQNALHIEEWNDYKKLIDKIFKGKAF